MSVTVIYNPDPFTIFLIGTVGVPFLSPGNQPFIMTATISPNPNNYVLQFDHIENFSAGIPPGVGPAVQIGPNAASISVATTGVPTTAGNNYGIRYVFNVIGPAEPTQVSAPYLVNIVPICIDHSSEILLADKTTRPIYQIKRGDFVAADISNTKYYQVANVSITPIAANSAIDVVVFEKGSLTDTNKRLIITHNHSVIYDGARRYADKFVDFPGVSRYTNIKVADILTPNDNGHYHLYDLQFEIVGSYVANGITIQSRSPRSFITPLPRELYFDNKLFNPELMDDNDPAYDLPLKFNLAQKKN